MWELRSPATPGAPQLVGAPDDDREGHDRDRDEPLNGEIRALAGDTHTFLLSPDFERAAGLERGQHKPERAWRRFADMNGESLPRPLADAIERVVELARDGAPTIASPALRRAA